MTQEIPPQIQQNVTRYIYIEQYPFSCEVPRDGKLQGHNKRCSSPCNQETCRFLQGTSAGIIRRSNKSSTRQSRCETAMNRLGIESNQNGPEYTRQNASPEVTAQNSASLGGLEPPICRSLLSKKMESRSRLHNPIMLQAH